jgi:hypothetical protein
VRQLGPGMPIVMAWEISVAPYMSEEGEKRRAHGSRSYFSQQQINQRRRPGHPHQRGGDSGRDPGGEIAARAQGSGVEG